MFHDDIPGNGDFYVLDNLEMSSFENFSTDELNFLSSSSQSSVEKYSAEDKLSQDEHYNENGEKKSLLHGSPHGSSHEYPRGRKSETPDSGGYGGDLT